MSSHLGHPDVNELFGESSDRDNNVADGMKTMTTLKGNMGVRINKALFKVEEKKRKRALRRAQVSTKCIYVKIASQTTLFPLDVPL